jgi:FixJ family two-component response regulator
MKTKSALSHSDIAASDNAEKHPANKERARKTGAKTFLQKPTDNSELLKLIRRALGEPARPEKSAVHHIGSL